MAVRTRRRAEIREVAVRLFSERGFYGTGVENVAGALGMAASSLYNHWRSKQELLSDIMLTTMTELIDDFDSATAGRSPIDALGAVVRAHVRYHATHRDDVRIGNREISTLREPDRSQLLSLRSTYANRWKMLIRAGVDSGDFVVDSIDLTTFALLEMGIGVHQWFKPDGPLTVEEIASHYSTMAWRQLVADGRVSDRPEDGGSEST